jgi:hypothetical protein
MNSWTGGIKYETISPMLKDSEGRAKDFENLAEICHGLLQEVMIHEQRGPFRHGLAHIFARRSSWSTI